MKSITDTYRLSNGKTIPCVGFGTWQTPNETAVESVKNAIKCGYRHIDTASQYGNEKSVAQGIKESGINRKDLFITTKLWNDDRGYDSTLKAFDKSMKELNLDYLDLYLMHWPAVGKDGDKINHETWKAFEKLYKEGRIKSIGISNFLVHHIQPLIDKAEVKPMVNQLEFHPGYTQPEIVQFCHKNDIVVEAWSPLGSGSVLKNPKLTEIAKKYNKSTAQLCIRWCLQNKTLPLPKSVTPERIIANTQVFDFNISDEDMKIITQLPKMGFSGLFPDEN